MTGRYRTIVADRRVDVELRVVLERAAATEPEADRAL
jgi:hypothetical protein